VHKMSMDKEESNRVITEYMDLDPQWNGLKYVYPLYSSSLDALVPVWEKLQWSLKITWLPYNGIIFYFENNERGCEIKEIHHDCSETYEIQEASAIATAKAILSLP